MPVTIKVNGTCLSLVHKMSNGISMATIPDVCKTPTPGGPVPIPYPNIAQSITLSNGTTTVKGDKVMAANKGSKFSLSNGDNAGTIGGVKSNVFMKEATWLLYSFDVKMDNKNTCRLTDPMYHNSENTVNLAGEAQQSLIDKIGDKKTADELCAAACQAMEDKKNKDKANQKKDGTYKKGKRPASYQREMRNNLDPKIDGVGRGTGGFLTEVGQRVTTKGGGLFIGMWGTATRIAKYVRWDIIVPNGPVAVGKLTLEMVKFLVEVKFPNDSFTANQGDMRDKMRSGEMNDKIVEMDVEKDCKC